MADTANSSAEEKDPRVYLAVERTYLAWIRTGLGLMGVGFALSRLGLFLRQFMALERNVPIVNAHSTAAGVALVVLGVIVNIAATVRHYRITRELATGTWQPGQVAKQAVILAIVLAVAGTALAVYLLVLR